ncbi:hypothetical protein D9M71_638560 [compost metagenome]
MIQIVPALVGVVDRARLILGHRIDGEVATDQVLFQGYVGAGVKSEPAVASPTLALGARQGVFLTGFRVQEHRKIGTHRPIALS